MVKIEYFCKGKSLGVFDVKRGSNNTDRNEVAEANGIDIYDRFILDDGRLDVSLLECDSYYVDSEGFLWIVKGKGQGYQKALDDLRKEQDKEDVE